MNKLFEEPKLIINISGNVRHGILTTNHKPEKASADAVFAIKSVQIELIA